MTASRLTKFIKDRLDIIGGIESPIQHPGLMILATMSPTERKKAHITDELVRLSFGCEDYRDLICDLEQVLNKI